MQTGGEDFWKEMHQFNTNVMTCWSCERDWSNSTPGPLRYFYKMPQIVCHQKHPPCRMKTFFFFNFCKQSASLHLLAEVPPWPSAIDLVS